MTTPADEGTALVDALVALVITGIVCLVTTSAVVTVVRSEVVTRAMLDRAQAVAAVSFALSRDVGSSDTLVVGDDILTPGLEVITFRRSGDLVATYHLDDSVLVASHPLEQDIEVRELPTSTTTTGTNPPVSVELTAGRVSLLVHFADGTVSCLSASRHRS